MTSRNTQDLNNTSIVVYGPCVTLITLAELAGGSNAQMEVEVDSVTALKKLAARDSRTIDHAIGFSRNAVSAEQARLFNEKLRLLKRNGTIRKICRNTV